MNFEDRGQLSGAVVLVARHGKVAYLETFGDSDREVGVPMREDTIFRIASQTKALVSVATMIFQEEGRLLLTDRVSKYLRGFRETTVAVPQGDGTYEIVDANRPIVIRDLLTQHGGDRLRQWPGR